MGGRQPLPYPFWGERDGHPPGQIVEILPIIDLWLINEQAITVAHMFARSAWVARAIRLRQSGS
jgi:hypothetical protein